MRLLEKRAVALGGGVNHRLGLYDAMMIKDTHIELIDQLNILLNVPSYVLQILGRAPMRLKTQ